MSNYIRYATYIFLTILIVWGDTLAAQTTGTAHIPDVLDMSFWFRSLLSGLLAILIWLAKGTDTRLKLLERGHREFDLLKVERGQRQAVLETGHTEMKARVDLLNAQLQLQRELLLTQYPTKVDIERHQAHIEARLDKIMEQVVANGRPHNQRATDIK